MPFVYSLEAQQALGRLLTQDRLRSYLSASKGDMPEALRLYEYNTRVSECLFGVIQGLEIAFRNSCHLTISAGTGRLDWYDHIGLGAQEAESVTTAKRNLLRFRKAVTPPGVISELTFGFWVRIISPSYEKKLWVKHLYKAMPRMARADRRTAFDRMERIRKLRNRIAHHEPIFQRNLKAEYDMIIEATSWICPVTAQWIHNTNSFVRGAFR
jgi:hypothetical protein